MCGEEPDHVHERRNFGLANWSMAEYHGIMVS